MRLEAVPVQRLIHPDAGELRLAFETMALPDTDEQHLIADPPNDDQQRLRWTGWCVRARRRDQP